MTEAQIRAALLQRNPDYVIKDLRPLPAANATEAGWQATIVYDGREWEWVWAPRRNSAGMAGGGAIGRDRACASHGEEVSSHGEEADKEGRQGLLT